MESKDSSEQTSKLYRQAENIFKKQIPEHLYNINLSPEEIRQMIHELQVHQTELEMQNDELRQIQTNLDEARSRYFDLYDLAPVGYLTLSQKGLITEANLTAATMLGTSRSKLVGQPLTGYIFEEYQDIYYLNRKQCLETGQLKACDLKLLYKDGSPFWVHLTTSIVRYKDDSFVLRVVITGIGELKAVEEALRCSEERFRLLYDKTPLGYQSLDLNGHFIEVNQTWLDTLGYLREDVIGKSFADFLHPDWRNHFKENFPRFKSIGEVMGVEFEMVKKDRSYLLVSFDGKIGMDKDGNFQQTYCVFKDITERRRAENAEKSIQIAKTALAKVKALKNQLKAERDYLQEEIRLEHNHQDIIGQSNAIKSVLHKVEQIAGSHTAVLVLGETGTGKELVARAIHSLSQRKNRALVKVNCAALPSTRPSDSNSEKMHVNIVVETIVS
ncbi:MAG: PAS domain S-box protein [Desulfamplus sp.]|nr:PAS domain S-box protein [Desulfamplus sp.]